MMEGTASTSETSKIDSLGESVSAYCKIVHDTDGGFDLTKLNALCQEILTENCFSQFLPFAKAVFRMCREGVA